MNMPKHQYWQGIKLKTTNSRFNRLVPIYTQPHIFPYNEALRV